MKTMNNNPNEKSSNSQCAQMLSYLQSGKTFTTLDALYLFNCIRCSARIANLRERGVNIKTEMIVTSTGKRVARYSLSD